MPSAISVRGLEKRFGEVRAVRGVDLDVEAGTVLALLGPNGAGKTTTVEILEGFLRPDAGEVRVLGLDPSRQRQVLLPRIGIVLQECAVEQFLTVRETFERRASYYPHPRSVPEIIKAVGLEEKAGARVRTLSGGQQRRLDLGLGLVGDPEVLFLDEPTTGFDPSARREAWEVVHELASKGLTVLLTTHYMDEAQALADLVAVIARGKIVAAGTPESIGGRASGDATVRFGWPAGLESLDGLALGDGTMWSVLDTADGRLVEVRTSAPTGVLHRLTAWAVDRGVELERLEVARPSLEDVYLSITADEAGTP
jgi:ABC-2 type transport system ATP-binding protein